MRGLQKLKSKKRMLKDEKKLKTIKGNIEQFCFKMAPE